MVVRTGVHIGKAGCHPPCPDCPCDPGLIALPLELFLDQQKGGMREIQDFLWEIDLHGDTPQSLGVLPTPLPAWAPRGMLPSTEHVLDPDETMATNSREYPACTKGRLGRNPWSLHVIIREAPIHQYPLLILWVRIVFRLGPRLMPS